MHNLFSRIKSWIRATWQAVFPGQRAWHGAAYGIAILYALTIALINLTVPTPGVWYWISVFGLLLFGLGMAFLSGALSDLVMQILNGIPGFYRAVLIGVGVLMALMVLPNKSMPGMLAFIAALVIPASLLGAGLWTLLRGGWSRLTHLRRAIAAAGLALGALLLVALIVAYLWPGVPYPTATPLASAKILPLQAEDPSQPGPYTVRTLTYGSGTDLRCPEFAADAALRTPSLDGSAYVEGWEDFSGMLRTSYWGFDVKNLPLNGHVWYSDSNEPAPLVLIVHGNHNMLEFSDPGYAYLGELLASRGMILVSVDENFLNSAWIDFMPFGTPAGLKEENDGRGWLLLEHIRQFETWNRTPDSPFYGKVDMQRIVVMGHSRGGEAATIAAALNRLSAYPDDANLALDYHFNIRGVVAIAPPDGQWTPGRRTLPLEDINYLALQGAYDADMYYFAGSRQYERLKFTGANDYFKTSVYIDRANHGQFNSVWGRSDLGGFPDKGQLNLAQLMPESDQQQIAKVFISAFLEATLNDKSEYRALFQDPRRASAWLPTTTYLARYDDSHTAYLATFEEDIDAQRGTAPGVLLDGEGLSTWYERYVDQRHGVHETLAVRLEWDKEKTGKTAVYKIDLSAAEESAPSAANTLVFALASASADQPAQDFTILLADQAGNTASLPLSSFAPLPPQIVFHPFKLDLLNREGYKLSEPVFQTFEFLLSCFQRANPQFNPAELVEIRFIFDLTDKGALWLDDVGLR